MAILRNNSHNRLKLYIGLKIGSKGKRRLACLREEHPLRGFSGKPRLPS